MKAVILAGGLGSRLRPFTEVIPKPLLPLGEHSLLEIQIKHLQQAGFEEIFIATNYKSELIEAYLGNGEKFGIKLTYSRETTRLGTCGPLSLLRDQLNEPFVMMNGDVLTKANLGDLYQVGLTRSTELMVGTKVIVTPFRFGNVWADKNDVITGIEEKPELSFEIIAGIYFFKPSIFNKIPHNTYFGMDQLITSMLNDGAPVSRYLIKDYWLDIGQVDDYSAAREEYNKNFLNE
jgi:NDP-mannose synthase